ncbi:Xylose isomerase domain protein TIM barrel [Pseudarthrobacter chlorophenolicus A6]|uniref:Xylose isomerase domain protein TIM barrel n=1 Tax=Pseudarthrobacter chlorophenolicus (strain ATCC 700700 / DSM 12829 / CIP 107037 / JCM 12360 / KCTC 9906 / NCIMB 13794 / A6) TaxID=452863 RepID=B8HAJ4_PSECP|nr:TIM barrel protein [Pseudarthrobacter chlorophenolicus]ACL38455.1 Xylose isomerase domain protein TIM barrel [Pseudarthrobacter chlorophenolicus A6]SDQ48493.1 Sugar phosphate isomerase/epimerase [Pseudarthrobacter chlorophenolicus]
MQYLPEGRPVLTVSTLGAPGEGLGTVLGWLAANGVSGVELRLAPGEIAAPAMTRQERARLRSEVADAGVAITGLASYIRVADPAPDELVVGALEAALFLAADLGAPTVRVFPGAPTEPADYQEVPRTTAARHEVDALAARRLTAVGRLAEELDVFPALETHDSHPRGQDIAAILAQVEGRVGAVWDLMHPWRVGEGLEDTWNVLAPWLISGLGSVQVKDAGLPASRTPVPIGDGTLPVDGFARLLRDRGYTGLLCLEWEKAWHPDAVRLDTALESTKAWYLRHWPDRPPADNSRNQPAPARDTVVETP